MKLHGKDYRRSRYHNHEHKKRTPLGTEATVATNATMLIPIRSGAADVDDETPQEWSLLELNGELIPPPGGTSTVATTTTSGTGTGTRMELGSVRFASDVSQRPCYISVCALCEINICCFLRIKFYLRVIILLTKLLPPFSPPATPQISGSSSHGKYITIND